ncbi:MAG: hypothetical protein ACOY71_09550 [Gemmatimonadota bacterium]
MNQHQLEGAWRQARGMIRETWARFRNDDVGVMLGKRDRLVGLLQRTWGAARTEVERRLAVSGHGAWSRLRVAK